MPVADPVAPWLLVGRLVAGNLRARAAHAAGRRVDGDGATHSSLTPEQSVRYIDRVFSAYAAHAGPLEGRTVLEVGPGDSTGVALRFLAAGARRVVCLDRFRPEAAPERTRPIHLALLGSLEGDARDRLAELLTPEGDVRTDRLEAVYDVPVEDAGDALGAGTFDLIVSWAVLEEAADLPAAFAAMDALLAPGGTMIHGVDLRDYGMFTSHGHPPLTFLTVGDRAYRLMTSHTPRPNRRRVSSYREELERRGYEVRVLVTQVLGRQPVAEPLDALRAGVDFDEQTLAIIRAARARLAAPFREMPDSDLMVDGAQLIAHKPARRPD